MAQPLLHTRLACVLLLLGAAAAAGAPPPPPPNVIDDSLQWCELAGTSSHVTSPTPVPPNVTLAAALLPFATSLLADLPPGTTWGACAFVLNASGRGAKYVAAEQALANAALTVFGVSATFFTGRDQGGALIGAALYASDLTPKPLAAAQAACSAASLSQLVALLPSQTFGTVTVGRSSTVASPPDAAVKRPIVRGAAVKLRITSPCWLWRTVCYNYFYRGAWRRVCNWAC